WMSRIRSGISIYGLSSNPRALRAMCLYRGVIPMAMANPVTQVADAIDCAIEELKTQGVLIPGDQVLASFGNNYSDRGETNTLKIITVA
ncbi:MAG: pyruvate kinase, partial [Porticoccaceae bacterium]|nr:pyruvate kinase [Porticoccaceae bacterium]